MQFGIQRGGQIAETAAEALVLGVYEDGDLSPTVGRVDQALGGAIAASRERKELKGKVGESLSLLTLGALPAARVVLVGLGNRAQFTPETARRAAAAGARALERARATRAIFELFAGAGSSPEQIARAMVEGIGLVTYRFDRYLSGERPAPSLAEVQLVGPEGADLRDAVQVGEIMVRATNYARDLVNEPPNVLNPAELARRAGDLAAEKGLAIKVFEPEEMSRRGMGALLAVGQGSENPPRLIVLRYQAQGAGSKPTLGLVGKGITFDTGGISIKPGADMHIMKTDMGGAGAMLGAMYAIAELKPALNVTMIVASAENMPDGKAFRPGDILRAMNGKTIEIQNTDAEGRLVLADALSYAVELGLAPIVDAATLTGACSVALGPYYSGFYASDDATRDALLSAARTAGDRIWHMPLDPDFRPLLDSSCADLRNIGGREGGSITAAMFLKEFVGEQPWGHLDIAPTAFADNEMPYYAKGLATGHPVRALAQLALDLANWPR